jgi:hypothetical protein
VSAVLDTSQLRTSSRSALHARSPLISERAEAYFQVGSTDVLKTDPKDHLPVPALAPIEECAAGLARIRNRVMRRLQADELTQAVCVVDELLLIEASG